jgi:hypothetical protein
MKKIAFLLLVLALCLPVLAQGPKASTHSAVAIGTVTTSATVAALDDKGNPDAKVWVNTASGVYHCPGTRWYGATKHGEYMTQAEAQKKGNRPAYGKVCK